MIINQNSSVARETDNVSVYMFFYVSKWINLNEEGGSNLRTWQAQEREENLCFGNVLFSTFGAK